MLHLVAMILNLIIYIHDMQDIHQLTLVGMNTLNLNIEHGLSADLNLVVLLYILSQSALTDGLNLCNILLELRIINELHDLSQGMLYIMSPSTGQTAVNQMSQLVISN